MNPSPIDDSQNTPRLTRRAGSILRASRFKILTEGRAAQPSGEDSRAQRPKLGQFAGPGFAVMIVELVGASAQANWRQRIRFNPFRNIGVVRCST